jgi:hypothetical protein
MAQFATPSSRSVVLLLFSLLFCSSTFGGQLQPVVKALWVLPTEFADGANKIPQPGFETEGIHFLNAFRRKAPALASAEILRGPDVTRDKVLNKLREGLSSLPPGSIFVFYYAGHGIRPANPNNSTGTHGSTYLAMRGCELGEHTPTFNNMVMLEEIMDLQSTYENVYFMGYIDACFSGNSPLGADQSFWSHSLGARGFVLCSSGADRKSYAPDFTRALIAAYERDDIFQKIRNPKILTDEVTRIGNFATEQVPRLIPKDCNLRTIFPLPGLCFFCIDFHGLVEKVINVKITPAAGDSELLTFNDPPTMIGAIAFAIPQSKDTKVTVNFTSQVECPFILNLVGQTFARESCTSADVPRVASVSDSSVPATRTAFESLVTRATQFGVSGDDVIRLGAALLTAHFSTLDRSRYGDLVSAEAKFLAELAPDSASVEPIRLLAGIDQPAMNRDGLAALEDAIRIGVPAKPALAKAYAEQIAANVQLLQTDPGKSWIQPKELINKFAVANKALALYPDVEAARSLKASFVATADPKRRVLSPRDVDAIGEQLSPMIAQASPSASNREYVASKTTTTTTTGGGTITEFTPGSSIVLKESSGPRLFRFGKTVTYVTKSGKMLDEDTVRTRIKVGVPVHVHYVGTGDDMMVDRIIIDDDK